LAVSNSSTSGTLETEKKYVGWNGWVRESEGARLLRKKFILRVTVTDTSLVKLILNESGTYPLN
jgi:hypothetical protein